MKILLVQENMLLQKFIVLKACVLFSCLNLIVLIYSFPPLYEDLQI